MPAARKDTYQPVYKAGRELRMDGKIVRIGEDVPHAEDWPRVESWVRSRHLVKKD